MCIRDSAGHGQHHGKQKHAAEQLGSGEFALQKQGDGKAQHHDERHADEQEPQGVGRRQAEGRGAEHLGVIGKAHEGGAAHAEGDGVPQGDGEGHGEKHRKPRQHRRRQQPGRAPPVSYTHLHHAVQDVGLADEIGHEGVGGLVINVLRAAHLLDGAALHHHHGVRHGEGFLLVVGDVDEGDLQALLDALELDLHLFAQLEVQRAEGLVQ